MNIKEAKEYIKDAVKIYLKKDEFDEYVIPVERQRPIFMLGAPGLGKTAVMEQIASEMGIALVSYSMTHHTRQSALGLPFITHKNYGGVESDVTEYTMSEIIASMYETMENSGITEGILFLDEINCVSETLAPAMLLFLQYKVFGRHRVPDGWVIVTAGNPPEYNKAVREFDVVVMDRLKVISVDADYETWKEYALWQHVHASIVSFLDLKPDYFYRIENTASGRSYVTARGWEDMSTVISLYEQEGLKVDENLIRQYLNNDKVAREYAAYYELFNKYKKDYGINDILSGNAEDATIMRAKNAPFDERISLLGMLIDRVIYDTGNAIVMTDYLAELHKLLSVIKEKSLEGTDYAEILMRMRNTEADRLKRAGGAGALSKDEIQKKRMLVRFLDTILDESCDFNGISDRYAAQLNKIKELTATCSDELHQLFDFCARAFENGNEMLLLMTELTVNTYSSRFISRFKCEDYYKHDDELQLSGRLNEIDKEIDELFSE